MLSHSQIKRASKLQYQIEGQKQGTYFGDKMSRCPDCCYEHQEPQTLPQLSKLEKEAEKP